MANNLEQSKVDRAPVGWRFWLCWVLVYTVGWALSWDVEPVWHVGLSIGWAVNGAMQWAVLRKHLSRAGWWVLATAVGSGVGLAVGTLAWYFDSAVGAAVPGALAGALVGAMQWAILRRHVSRAGQWLLASTLAWAVALFVEWPGWPWRLDTAVRRAIQDALWFRLGIAVSETAYYRVLKPMSSFVGHVPVGAMSGVITGAALVWLLRQPLAPEAEAAEE